MKIRLSTVLLAVTASVTLAACSSSSGSNPGGGTATGGGTSTEPINVVALQAVSGSLAASAQVDVSALKAAVAVVNASGGVNGRQLHLEILDDKGDGTQAVSLLRGKIDSGKIPDILVDGTSTPESLALQPLVSQYNILTISTSTGGLSIDSTVAKNRTKFATTPDVTVLANTSAKYMVSKGYHKVAFLSSSDGYGKLWVGAYSKAAQAAGLEVTATKSFDLTALDLTPQLQALQESHPDVLYAEAYGPPAGYVLSGREKLGWTGTPMIGAVTFSVADLTKIVDAGALKNVIVQAPTVLKYVEPDQMSPNVKTFIDAIKAEGPITSAISGYAFEYDAIQVAAAAIKKAGSTNASKVAEALENLGEVATTVVQSTYYRPDSHFPSQVDSAWVFLTPGPLVDGMIKS